MPSLYDQSTNLSTQGRFAPGVNYYAGVKAPRRNDFTLPKANASFNIDLSAIGNAMIRSAELDAQLEQAKIARQDKLNELAMEDKRARDLAELDRKYKYDQLAVTREGNWLDYKAAIYKVDNAKGSKDKDYTWQNELDQFLRNLANERDQKGGSHIKYQARAETFRDNLINKFGSANVDPDQLNTLMERYGFGYKAMRESIEEDEKNVRTAENNLFQKEYEDNPFLQSFGPTDARAKWNVLQTQLRAFQQEQTVINNPNSTAEEIEVAKKNRVSTGVNLIRQGIFTDIYNSAQLDKFPTNPVQYKQAIINRNIKRLIDSGTEYNDAVLIVNQASKSLGLDRFTEDAVRFFKEDSEVAKNVITGMLSDTQIQWMSVPAYKAWLALDSNSRQGLTANPKYSDEVMQMNLAMIEGKTFGTIDPENHTFTLDGVTYTAEEIELMRDATGVKDPRQAILTYQVMTLDNTSSNAYDGLVTNEDMIKKTNDASAAYFGNNEIHSKEDVLTSTENAKRLTPIWEKTLKVCKDTGQGDINTCLMTTGALHLEEDIELNNAVYNVMNSTKTMGQPVKIGVQKDGDNIKIFYMKSEGFDITSDNYNYIKDLEKRIREKPETFSAKLFYLRSKMGEDRIELIAPGVEVEENVPNILQKGVNIINEADTTLMQGVSENINKDKIKSAINDLKNTPVGQAVSSVVELGEEIADKIVDKLKE